MGHKRHAGKTLEGERELPLPINTVQLASITGLAAGSVIGVLAAYHRQKNPKANIGLLNIFAALLFIAAIGELAAGSERFFLLDLIMGLIFINTQNTMAIILVNVILVIGSLAFISYIKPGILSLSYLIAVLGVMVGALRIVELMKRFRRNVIHSY